MALRKSRLVAALLIVAANAACGGRASTADETGGSAGIGGAVGGSDGSGGSGRSGGSGGTSATTTATGGASGTGGYAGSDAPGCGVIRASDYDQTCKADSDCVEVFSGDTCVDCPCSNAAINKNAAAGYHQLIPVGGPSCYCISSASWCVGGVCTIDAPACGVIRASDYDQSCKSAQDCALVFEGDTCNGCPCPNATINKAALASYPPVSRGCNCPMDPLPSCVSGVCVMCPPPGCPAKDGGAHD